MFRSLHRYAGIGFALILIVVSLTGTILSVFPLLDADRTSARLNAGALAEAVMQSVPGVEQILVNDNNVMTAVAFGPDGFVQQVIDPATGAVLGPVTQSQTELWFENLHRALLLSDTGHIVVLIATGAMIALGISGLWLAARRLGGWRKIFSRDHGEGAGKLHLRLARFAIIGLLVSSLSGLWMGASTLGLIDEGSPQPAFPMSVSADTAASPSQLPALLAISGDTLRQITLPRAGIPGQAWQVQTDAGAGYIDPATGQMLTWADRPLSSKVMGLMHLLHTGQGASVLGLLLGLIALSVPVLSGTGLLVWLSGRPRKAKVPQTRAQAADLVVLVGSEGGTTWRFARAFAACAHAAGKSVHLAEMNDFAPQTYKKAEHILLFAATYGDGDAPDTATEFLTALDAADAPNAALTVLGFGDDGYPAFCGYAHAVSDAITAKGWTQTLALTCINRQSTSEFAAWADAWGQATGIALKDILGALDPVQVQPLTLISSRVYGEDVQAPTAILRFALPHRSLPQRFFGLGKLQFEAGDLLDVLPQESDCPRSYSLASTATDGFVEICVRKKAGGLCSGQLFALKAGDQIQAAVRRNAAFHMPRDDKPLILIGAGAGIGPLAGFARAATGQQVHLFYGSRSTGADLPYAEELTQWADHGQVASVALAWSRGVRPRYVQQALLDDAARLQQLIADGARIMICGSQSMGSGVAEALNQILEHLGLTVDGLRKENRYAADVF
jgi:sulfite reductase (NADPH) flavoprotein alpha-component